MRPLEKRNLYQRLSSLAALDPDRPILKDGSDVLTASALFQQATAAVNAFSSFGITTGTLAALSAPRRMTTAVLLLGLRFSGAVAMLFDPRQSTEEILSECETKLPLAFSVSTDGSGSIAATRLSDGYTVSVSLFFSSAPAFDPGYDPDDAAFLLFTSGSTGAKKAVVLSESNLIVDLIVSEPLGLYLPDDIALGALPLDHVFGLVLLLGTIVLGYRLYFPKSTNVDSLLLAVASERITRMNGVPSLYLRMAERAKDYDLSSLRAGFIAGGPVTKAQFLHIEKALEMTLISVYGMTECIGISCSDWRDRQDVRASGVGPFYTVNRGRIVLEDGTPAEIGQIGEIQVNGPMRMLGYYGEPMAKDAFLSTCDLGYLDETGVLHLCGRKKDILIRNGYNLSSARIEAALLSLPGVSAAAVVGLPDAMQGEVPCAMIVGQADLSLLAEKLRKNELPVRIVSVSKLPMTPLGKPDKQAIREALRV